MKNLENRPGTMKNQLRIMKNHENPPKTMKNHENPPETMKSQPVTIKNHENRPGTMKNQPGTMKNDENPPGTLNNQEKNNLELYRVVTGDFRRLQGGSGHFSLQNLPIMYKYVFLFCK